MRMASFAVKVLFNLGQNCTSELIRGIPVSWVRDTAFNAYVVGFFLDCILAVPKSFLVLDIY